MKKRRGKIVLGMILTCSLLIESSATAGAAARNESAAFTEAAGEAAIERSTPEQKLGYVPGEILVTYKADITDEQIEEAAVELDGNVLDTVTQVADTTTVIVDIADDTTVAAAVQEYSADANVKYATPNYIFNLYEEEDTVEASGVNDTYLSRQDYLEKIHALEAWNYIQRGTHDKVKVVVLDSGADIHHEDLQGVINLEESKEILDDLTIGSLQGDGYINGADTDSSNKSSHGTHVCGILAAQANNGTGIAGVGSAGDNSCMDLVVVDVFTGKKTTKLSHVLKGLEYADSIGARVVNLSLGMKATSDTVASFQEVCDTLESKGITLVCAAGNDGISDQGEITTIPSDYASTISVISVGTSAGEKASYSNYGTLKDISAPGTDVYSTYDATTFGTAYHAMSGTSMSAPMVTATAALMLSVSDYTPAQIKEKLRTTATDIGAEGFDPETASGLLDTVEAVIPDVSFDDVSKEDWFYKYVKYVADRGIMTGMTDTIFGPVTQLSRAQFATILYRMEGSPAVEYKNTFQDVKDGQFYTAAVLWAGEYGIVTGYSGTGQFGPADNITREQMALMMYRFARYKQYDISASNDLSGFPDASDVSGFAIEGMRWAVGAGLISGSQGQILPQGEASRAECAAIMRRFMEKFNV